MTAAVHVVCGPAGSGKTQRLAERYRTVAERSPGAALWLVPTHRAVEAAREQLLPGLPCCLIPNLFTFDDLGAEVIHANDPAARPLTGVQRRLLLDDLVSRLSDRGELSHFARVADTRGFAESVSALVAALKAQEVRPIDFARAVLRRADRRSEPHAAHKERQWARLYAQYQRLLVRHHLYDLEGRLWHARDLLRDGRCRPFEDVRAVFVDGFVEFTRTQHDILGELARRVEELWITLPEEPDTDRSELFSRPRATLVALASFQPTIERLALPQSASPAIRRPTGLVHVERQLFRPLRQVRLSDDAEGITLIEAPGVLGETRLVARAIKALLLEGVAAEDVLVTMRSITPYADLVREVFGEYGIPIDVEGTEPLTRSPAIALLLRAARLPDDDWPFAAVTALLRSGWFWPEWPEGAPGDQPRLEAEALLRLLGEPRGRDAYLAAVRRWAEDPPTGLEDEDAQESRRRRMHTLAQKCRPFLERFFRAWDAAPAQATLADHVAWLEALAAVLGIDRAAAERPADRASWQRFRNEVHAWIDLERQVHGPDHLLDRRIFLRRLIVAAGQTGRARTPRGPGRVRVLSAPLARHLDASYLFLMGLGERSFPRLTPIEPLFDDEERQTFRRAGLELPGAADQLPDEMLLFYQLVTRPRRRLVLSYPAVDAKGQALLPSSFLSLLLDSFSPRTVPVLRRRMLIEGFDRDAPCSPAEHRVRLARLLSSGKTGPLSLPRDLAANLRAAANLVRRRFHERAYNPYDGMFRDPAVIGELQQLFGPEKVFSPTALEDYVACPFRFLLRHVLHLEPLDEPREEIEVTQRGRAVHRALSRLHLQLRASGTHAPADGLDAVYQEELRLAVAEDMARAPSPASKELWRLEGQRLLRGAARYPEQWQRFVQPWLELRVTPQPYDFEVSFGLPATGDQPPAGPLVIREDGVEVRISGRIDRVDVAETADGSFFWVIDYKTGRSSYYTSGDLAEFRRLQLTLYTLAVEEVLLADRGARPLGMAYWMITETGPKVVLPAQDQLLWFEETERWRKVRHDLRRWVTRLVLNIRGGAFPLRPRSEHCTQTCDFGQVCRITQSRHVGKDWELPLPHDEV